MIPHNKLELFARAGYAARGVVYVLTGGMALLSSFGGGGPDSKSAMQVLLSKPLGQVWLGLIGVGLIGFIVWRLIQAIFNTDHREHDIKGYAIRAAMLISAATYTSLASFAIGQALHLGFGGGSSGGGSKWTGWLMSQPFGRYLVALLALAILGSGIAQIIRGAGRRYRQYFDRNWQERKGLDAVCMFGLIARGALFLIVGGFFMYAAIAVDPQQAGGTGDALVWVRQVPLGWLLYMLAALGLFAFGAYGLIEARYRRIDPPTVAQAKQAIAI